jgi:hypothetical protein
MLWSAIDRLWKNFSAFSLAFALAGAASVPCLAQSNTPNDSPLISRHSSAFAAGISSAPESSTKKSASDLSSLPPDAQGAISAALGKDDSGYWLQLSAEGLRGENPRHALAAEFTKLGAEVRSHNLRWALAMRAYGYGDALHPVQAVAPQGNANRVEYRRDGVTEWYENGPLGLEQGFTLAHRPGRAPGKKNDKPMTLELALCGDLLASREQGGSALELRGEDGRAVLRYSGLGARDASGRALRSWLDVRGGRLLVRVDDTGAKYPVVVDPWIQQAELTSSDGAASDNFGMSVAISGGTVVVGAPGHSVGSNPDQGAAYVFVQNSDGTWIQQAELTASDGATLDYFGFSVAVSGGTIVAGAPDHTVGTNASQGAAYVFVQSGITWIQQAELISSDGGTDDYFGDSVAVNGSTVVVGAPCHTGIGQGCSATAHVGPGAAYVFVQSGTTWSQQAELTASDGSDRNFFGRAVAVSGGTAVVGAPYHGEGAAYVFVQSGTTWSQQAELTAFDSAGGANFGNAVAVSGSTVLVGAPIYFIGANVGQGAAYVFAQSGTSWNQQAELTASDGAERDYFGGSVSLDGSSAVVGATHSSFGEGTAYVFTGSGGTWTQQQEMVAADEAPGDQFGSSVAVSGGTFVSGSNLHTVGGNVAQGAAYVFGSSGPLYTLSASPSSLTVAQGSQAASTITITRFDGFSGSVSLSALNLPSGVTAAFSTNPATNTSTLTLTASSTAAVGSAGVPVVGTSDGLAQTTALPLTVATSIRLSQTSLNFGNQAVDTTSATKRVTLKNTGTAALTISSIAITQGTNFAISKNSCQGTLNPNKVCNVDVTFTPTQLGALSDTLTFTDNAVGSPQAIPLSGTGVGQVTLTPASFTFTNTKVGKTGVARTFTLKNNLTTTLTGILYSTAAPFAVSSSTCGTTLNSKASCTINVTFSPASEQTFTGTLTVTDSANNSPQTSSLTGTGD